MSDREAKTKGQRAGRYFIGALVILIVLAVLAEVNRPPKIRFWGEAIRMDEPRVDDKRQLAALRAAQPSADAEKIFRPGECCLVANRAVAGTTYRVFFIGVPNSSFGARAEKSWRYKFIAPSVTLVTNETFIRLKEKYETEFNSRIVKLAEEDLERDRERRR